MRKVLFLDISLSTTASLVSCHDNSRDLPRGACRRVNGLVACERCSRIEAHRLVAWERHGTTNEECGARLCKCVRLLSIRDHASGPEGGDESDAMITHDPTMRQLLSHATLLSRIHISILRRRTESTNSRVLNLEEMRG